MRHTGVYIVILLVLSCKSQNEFTGYAFYKSSYWVEDQVEWKYPGFIEFSSDSLCIYNLVVSNEKPTYCMDITNTRRSSFAQEYQWEKDGVYVAFSRQTMLVKIREKKWVNGEYVTTFNSIYPVTKFVKKQ